MNLRYSLFIIVLVMLFASCKTASITKNSKTSLYKNEVFACYYHNKFNGRKTANGDIFSNSKLTAAHKTLTFGSQVLVTNLVNNKSVIVTINDRGPFTKGLEIDLSKKAFDAISHDKKAGKLSVKLELLNHSK
ncbi:MAG: septal ring lytic transglycosylase RlpA family protein [Myroides sp.]|nr:septal ring lytic transglycosylase RlpA family protein [Myroides sp.]MDO5635734.1 septal ring lytic transglycosylase RlpA family protein [Myroides sp.]